MRRKSVNISGQQQQQQQKQKHWSGLSDEEVEKRAKYLFSHANAHFGDTVNDNNNNNNINNGHSCIGADGTESQMSTGFASLDALFYYYWNPILQSNDGTDNANQNYKNNNYRSTFPSFQLIEFYSFFGGGKSFILKTMAASFIQHQSLLQRIGSPQNGNNKPTKNGFCSELDWDVYLLLTRPSSLAPARARHRTFPPEKSNNNNNNNDNKNSNLFLSSGWSFLFDSTQTNDGNDEIANSLDEYKRNHIHVVAIETPNHLLSAIAALTTKMTTSTAASDASSDVQSTGSGKSRVQRQVLIVIDDLSLLFLFPTVTQNNFALQWFSAELRCRLTLLLSQVRQLNLQNKNCDDSGDGRGLNVEVRVIMANGCAYYKDSALRHASTAGASTALMNTRYPRSNGGGGGGAFLFPPPMGGHCWRDGVSIRFLVEPSNPHLFCSPPFDQNNKLNKTKRSRDGEDDDEEDDDDNCVTDFESNDRRKKVQRAELDEMFFKRKITMVKGGTTCASAVI